MNKKLAIVSFLLNILLGIILFVFAEVDDSPGGQLIGLVVVVVGMLGLFSAKKRK